MARRLYKSRTERMIDGVCGGVAEYFNLDPTLVRIAWVVLTLAGGSGILLYIIAMIVIPTNPEVVSPSTPHKATTSNQKFWGILLVTVGIFLLAGNFGFPLWHRWWGFSWDMLLPLLFLLAGVAFLFGGRNYVSKASDEAPATTEGPAAAPPPPPPAPTRLYRSRSERKLFGVCGGLGAYFNIDPAIVRVLFVLAVLASFGIALFAYFLLAVVVPDEPHTVMAA